MTYMIPKISEYDFCGTNPEIEKYILKCGKLEIQMLQNDLFSSFENVKLVLNRYIDHLDYVCIHIPLSILNIDIIARSEYKTREFNLFINEIVRYSLQHDIELDFLTHISEDWQDILDSNTITLILNTLDMFGGTKVGLIIENGITRIDQDDGIQSTIERLFNTIHNPKFKVCIDVCHLQASENATQKEIKLSENILKNIKNIHFSMTLDHDGYKDKIRTHGRKHGEIEDMQNDLRYLQYKGINLSSVNLVAEINEADYTKRPDLLHELRLYDLILRRGDSGD